MPTDLTDNRAVHAARTQTAAPDEDVLLLTQEVEDEFGHQRFLRGLFYAFTILLWAGMGVAFFALIVWPALRSIAFTLAGV